MTKDIQLPEFLANRLSYRGWWDFCEQPDTFVLPLEPATAGANAGDDVSAALAGVVPRAAFLIGGALCVSANSAGIDANNTSAWTVTDGAATTLIDKTNAANLVADTPVALAAPSAPNLAANTAVKLAITNGTTADLNSASCLVTLTLADANNYPAPGLKTIAPNGGTATISDGAKGVLAISPGSSDNDEIYVAAAVETLKFAANKVFVAEAYVQFSEANTDDANIIFGLQNAVAANSLIDDGAGPRATGDYVAIWKVDGSTVWRAGVQSNGTQTPTTDTDSEVTAGGPSYQRLRMKIVCETSTRAWAEFTVDGVNIATIHFDYASATEMQAFVGVKNGGGNAETLNVDYFGAEALR